MIRTRLAIAGLIVASNVHAQGANPNPMDSIRKLPGYHDAHDTTSLISQSRVDALPPAARREWSAYLAASRALHTRDTAAMGRELRNAGVSAMTRAPYAHAFTVTKDMTSSWFGTDNAHQMTEAILSFQAPNGGWSKHVDFTKHLRQLGESYFAESAEWEWISTIDNDQTTAELWYLARADRAQHDARYVQAIGRGIDFLLASQYPNGCFPQVYPLQGSYHDAATFNDNATVNVLTYLRDVSEGAAPAATADRRSRAKRAVAAGIACILDAQVVVQGRRTAWGQQHDPITLEPVAARSYELTSLTALESAQIVDFLMTLDSPSDRIVRAVYAAIDWLQAVPISGYSYSAYELRKQDGAGLLWGRLYEIGTNRVIMANRDGIRLYDWDRLTDRRSGYGWYTTKPAETIAAFAVWSKTHPNAS